MFRLPWEKKPGLWTGCFIGLGLALRVFHYGRNPSMWHDEAALVLNAIGKNFTELLGPLFFAEGAPPLFLWIERAIFLALGDSTYVLRLVPFLASCLALILMAFVARRLLAPEAVPWSILPLACADTILWHACEAKPYSVDLLIATSLLAIYSYASSWPLSRQLVLYTVLAPLIIILTYPGCFLLGGLLVALLPAVWQARRSLSVWLGYGLLALVIFGSFALLLAGPIHAQRCGPMTQCWLDLFAPWDRPWKVPIWTVASTLEVLRYACPPAGQPLALLGVVGIVYFARRGQRTLLAFLLVPILLAFLAACARAYPYGGARVMVYAVPALLLLIAAGTPIALTWLRERSRFGTLMLVLLLLVPAASAVQHIIVPWGRANCAAASEYVLTHRRPGDLAVGNSWEYLYYFRHLPDDYLPLENASFPIETRVWLLLTGGPPQERLEMGKTYAALQGHIIEQRSYERTSLFLIEPNVSSSSWLRRTVWQTVLHLNTLEQPADLRAENRR
jgi:hypothetical protein